MAQKMAVCCCESSPNLSYELLQSPKWRDKGEPTTQDMIKQTAEFISHYWSLPEPTIAKVKKELHLMLACNYVLISNVGENVGTRTSGDTEDVLRSFMEKGTPSKKNSSSAAAPQTRDEQETINTLRALQELEDIQGKLEDDSPGIPLLTPSELRQVHQKLLEHDERCEPGKYRSVLVYTDETGPVKDPLGTINLHSKEICLRGIAASKELLELEATMDEVIHALAHRLDCKKDEQVILRKVAEDVGYIGRDDINEVISFLLPECISAMFGATSLGRIVAPSDSVGVADVLLKLAKHYGIKVASPLTIEDANNIHRQVVADLPSTFYIYPLKTPEMIEDELQELYTQQTKLSEAFSANFSVEDLQECQALEDALSFLARIAAYSLFCFVCLHPFRDGNGRMCRLIASAIMSAVVPFPTGLACEQMPGRKTHSVYVDAIVDCRQRGDQKPVELATLIVEGAYYCSRNMEICLREHLWLGEMTSAAKYNDVASNYEKLDHGKRPGGHQTDAEIRKIISQIEEAIVSEKDTVEVEFEDKYFVHIIDILL